jgi:hypothetical protein
VEFVRFWIRDFRSLDETPDIFCIDGSSDYSVRSGKHVRRNGKTDLARRLEVDDQLELGRLLNREITRVGAFDDFVDVRSSTTKLVCQIRSVDY